ncbi:MAG: hypothetical protein VKP62_05265, partial [Candidatus Sericytochromatia bacterium]|nr:hypothetical protein [Candidatus Sericytochromatia bacterium]
MPLSPVQLLLGSWQPANRREPPERSHELRGDTYLFKALGLALTRPEPFGWEFAPLPAGLALQTRIGPRVRPDGPLVRLTVVDLPPAAELAVALQADRRNVEQAGGGVVVSRVRLDGVEADSWWLTTPQASEAGQPARVVRTWRCYVPHEGVLTLFDAQALEGEFPAALAAFEAIAETLRVPLSASGATPGQRLPLQRSDSLVAPALGLTLRPLDTLRWLPSVRGNTLTLDRRDLPASATLAPLLKVTVGAIPPGVDWDRAVAQERAALEKTSPVQVSTATWLGQSAETWRWETRQAGALIAHERRTRRDGARVAIAEWA